MHDPCSIPIQYIPSGVDDMYILYTVYNEPTGFTKVCAAINEHLYGAGMSDSTVVNIGKYTDIRYV